MFIRRRSRVKTVNLDSFELESEDRRERVARWVAEHGIDPNDVLIDARIEADYHRETLTVEVCQRTSDGELTIAGNRPLTRVVTVPLRSAAP